MATSPTTTLDPEFAGEAPKPPKGKPNVPGTLQCVVVTPERTLLDEPVQFVALPLHDGELGVLPGRAP